VALLMRRKTRRAGTTAGLLAGMVVTLTGLPATAADAGWFESGDSLLRLDLQLLNDAGIIRLPMNEWPLPRAAVDYALQNGKPQFALNAAVVAALDRVRARLDAAYARRRAASFDAALVAGDSGLLRDFDSLGRDNGELRTHALFSAGERMEVSLTLSAAADPDDDQVLRADGSHATVALGNWLLSAQTLDRWWGPGHESSLILSNNARPMPTLLLERAAARPFASRWLDWLGPWRFSFGISRMENERADVDAPLFMAWRVVIMPFNDIELGFSRTAQFCGRQLPCDGESIKDMLIGNDNPGFDATLESEPGNQMAGFDIRWNSPIGSWPYAIYSQMIGEDESGYVPAKYLAQFGIEAWKTRADGGLIQVFAEYADTSCSGVSGRGAFFDCAYNQGQFDVEGYRYRGRVIGHTTDRDSRSAAVGASFTSNDGDLWTATARAAQLNRDVAPDPTNTVAHGPTDYVAFELGWRGKLFGERLELDLGVELVDPVAAGRDIRPFGFIRWSRALAP
jgi:hypothetical protein